MVSYCFSPSFCCPILFFLVSQLLLVKTSKSQRQPSAFIGFVFSVLHRRGSTLIAGEERFRKLVEQRGTSEAVQMSALYIGSLVGGHCLPGWTKGTKHPKLNKQSSNLTTHSALGHTTTRPPFLPHGSILFYFIYSGAPLTP